MGGGGTNVACVGTGGASPGKAAPACTKPTPAKSAAGAAAAAPGAAPKVAGAPMPDVMTTGASLYAAARVLRVAGASHITGLVFARTE